VSDRPTIIATSVPDAAEGHWDGDFWVESNGYRVSRKWCDLLPGYYGPCRKDPDNGLGHVEFQNRINEIIAKVTGITGIADCSSEIHAAQAGGYVGYLYLTTSSDIPPVPVFWCTGPTADNDSHYFLTGLIAGRAGRKIDDAASKINWTPVLVAIVGGLTAGTAYGQQILDILKGIF